MTNTARFRGVVAGAVLLVICCLTHAAGAAESPDAAGYPGTAPGPSAIEVQDGRITVKNAVLSASWTVTRQGLRPVAFRDQQAGQTLALADEAFQIVFADGLRYVASALQPDGGPTLTQLGPDPKASRLAARIPGRQVELSMRSADGRLRVVWRAVLHDGSNYIRQLIDITAPREDCVIKEIIWLDQTIPGARTSGRVDGSPVTAGNFFLGYEDPHALNLVGPGGAVACRLPRNATLKRGETLTQSLVIGVAPAGQMRRAFLHYLERERAHPYRTFLHYNSWYDIAWDPFAMNEANCLDAIRTFGDHLIKRHGVVVDAMVFDDGWDDPKTLWQFHRGFPNGFAPLADACRQYNTSLGVWLSPFGGYASPKEQRIKFGREQGYEINAAGFSMAGPKYYAAFRQSCLDMIRKYGVNHFKFDGIAAGMSATGGGQYVLDTEAMRRLMLELRQEDPNLYINLTTGSWPSPFWLRYADSVWRQGGDMGLAGKGARQQQWLTYRDQETYRNIVGKGPLFPLNSLMTQGVAYSRRGSAGDPTFNSAGFRDDVRAFFGSGTGLQELYIQPGKLTDEDWTVLAEAAKWSRANADVLVDTHWIGGDPGKLEVYGWASWTPRKGIVTLRNPDDQPHEFALDVGAAFELPPGAATRFTLTSPWPDDAAKPAIAAEAGKPARLALKPFEVVVLDAR
ncbi:MAG: enterotoxin [Tepidisphaerales bacterium]